MSKSKQHKVRIEEVTETEITEKTIYLYGGNYFLKPEDKVRKHLFDALTVSGLDNKSVSTVTDFLCGGNLIFTIVNPNPIQIFIKGDDMFPSEKDAQEGTNCLNKK